MRREVPLIITFTVGMIMLMASLFTSSSGEGFIIKTWANQLGDWVIIISAFAVGLATVNLFRIHGGILARRRSGWFYSITLMVAIVGYSIIGIIARIGNVPQFAKINQQIYDNAMSPLGAAMFALAGFYIASASYRAFRMRSAEATVLLLAAIILMLGRAPIGELIWSRFPVMADWLFDIPNNAGQRALLIGGATGAFATSLRILLGMDRGHLGGTD